MTEPIQRYSHKKENKAKDLPNIYNNAKTMHHDLHHPILITTLPVREYCSHSIQRTTIKLREVRSTEPQSRYNVSSHSSVVKWGHNNYKHHNSILQINVKQTTNAYPYHLYSIIFTHTHTHPKLS